MKRLITAAALTIATTIAFAEDCTFPSTSGDLASAADWGRSVPGMTDSVLLTPGSYSFGGDVTFTNISLTKKGTYSFAAAGRAINLLKKNHQINLYSGGTAGITANLSGGTWDFNGLEFRGMFGNANLNLTDGASITHAGPFYPKYYASTAGRSTLTLSGASSISCGSFYTSEKDGNVTVNVTDGSKINASGEFCLDSRNTDKTGVSYSNVVVVTGAGSEINASGIRVGLKNRSDLYLHIRNGGKVTTTGGVYIGEANGKNKKLVMDQGTLVVGGNLEFKEDTTENNDNGIVAKDSTVTIAGNYDGSLGRYAFCDFQDVALTVNGTFTFFQSSWVGNQRLRFGGAKGTQPSCAKFTSDIYGTSPSAAGSTLIIDDHFRFEQGNATPILMGYARDCALIVTNYATYVAPASFKIGNTGSSAYEKKFASGTNSTLRITDHANFLVNGQFTFRVPSGGRLSVENGSTLVATNGIEIGNECKKYAVSACDSTLSTEGTFSIAYTGKADNGNVIAFTNTTVNCSNVVYYGIKGGYTDFQNVTFNLKKGAVWNPTSAGKASGYLFDGWFAGATLRLGGKKGNRPWGTALVNPYGSSSQATLIIDDGFCFTNNAFAKMLTNNRQCRLRVSGGAKYFSNSTTYIGHCDYNTSFSNAVEIADGGTLTGKSFFLMGTDNEMIISNGSLEVSADLGFGYQPSGAKYPTSGSKVLIAGETPRITAGCLWLHKDNELTIAIPAAGYADGVVPVNAGGVVFHTTASLKLDCADYLASEAGDTTLMTFSSRVGSRSASNNSKVTFAQWVRAQNAALGLPAGVPGLRLVADGSGSKLIFRKKSVGMSLIVR